MSATNEREPGFYWIKLDRDDEWQVAEWDGELNWWWLMGDDVPRGADMSHGEPDVIGERLTPPLESTTELSGGADAQFLEFTQWAT